MQKTTFILVTFLLAGLSFAQEKSASVESILNELDNYQAAPEAPVAPEAPAAPEVTPEPAMDPVPVVAEEAAPMVEAEEAPVAEELPDSDVDIPAVLEESRDLYAGGEFEQAQAGFEAVVKLEPENMIARMYLRKILERNFRGAEVGGVKAIKKSWDTSLVLRSYEISADAAERMELSDVTEATDITIKFPEVDFRKGSSAVYQPKMEKLFVRNTRENLTVLEEILEAMDVAKLSSDVEQVEVETKMVEISEGTLEELGFEWRSTGGANINTGIEGDDIDFNGKDFLFNDILRGGANAQPMPFSRPNQLGAGSSSASGEWSAFRFEDTFNQDAAQMTIQHQGGTPLDVVITALDQSTGADVLSAPRVVTKSGEEAIIRVGEVHMFPEVYEPNATGGNIVYVSYEDWEERLLGIELSVTPQVDGDQIEMELKPTILELQGWQTYDIAGADSAYTWYQGEIGIKFNHDAIQAQLPIFRKRVIETEVTIADGATFVMGGLINETIEDYEDKVPVLGSLPLVGRLFRSEGERAIKRNLMIFVTAKKVEPTGRISSSRSFE